MLGLSFFLEDSRPSTDSVCFKKIECAPVQTKGTAKMFRYFVNPNGPTVASVAKLKDGTFLEIVRDSEYQKEKRVFKEYKDWLATLPIGALILDTYLRSPFKPAKPAPLPPAPVDESLKDVPYLLALKQKYGIRTKPNPHKKNTLVKELENLKVDLEKNTELLGNKKDPLRSFTRYQDGKLRAEVAALEARIAENPAAATKPVYTQIFRKNAIALVQKDTRYVPLAYHSNDHVLIFEGKTGTTFEEVGLPPRPELWMQKGQRIFKAV